MEKTRILLGLLLLPFAVSSQGLIINTFNRNTTSLNGEWNYIVDPYETGYYNFHSEIYDQKNAGSPSAFYNNYHAKNHFEPVNHYFYD